MNIIHQQLTATRLQECRDEVSRLFGEGYAARMTEYARVVCSVANSRECGVLAAAGILANRTGGTAAICYLAAAFELLREPSAEQPA